ncbi:hypothetical protein [Microbacterium sp. SLBN-146]|uniref:hypothetical protein n=1 Tax=Microbacterium sp. SLBN-146 TaxID=2768457 RepID=UPI00116C43DD|nr:hypothetical protein [Microbacterium sp. SLBN-146]TQJ31575.1 hypothetical protein FBY39_2054 [Microbacterium sp. SLBN-146]
MTTSSIPTHSTSRFPLAAFLLALVGNIVVLAVVAVAFVAVLVSAVVIFAGELIGLG